MAIYKLFDINTATTVKPWGAREEQAMKDIIDTLVVDTIDVTKNTSGHLHGKLYASDSVSSFDSSTSNSVTITMQDNETSGLVIKNRTGTSIIEVDSSTTTPKATFNCDADVVGKLYGDIYDLYDNPMIETRHIDSIIYFTSDKTAGHDFNLDTATYTFRIHDDATELFRIHTPIATPEATFGISVNIAGALTASGEVEGGSLDINGSGDISGSIDVHGATHLYTTLTVDTIANVVTDTDRFIVSDSGIIKYRTGTQMLSDLSGDAGASFSWNSQSLTNVNDISCATINISSLTSGYLPYYTGSTLDDSPVYTDGTNVGIGMVPTQKLQASGSGTVRSQVISTDGAATLDIIGNSYATIMATQSSGRFDIYSAGGYDITLNSSGGNVAIGKTSASVELDVVGRVASTYNNSGTYSATASPTHQLSVYNSNTTSGGYANINFAIAGGSGTGNYYLGAVGNGVNSGAELFIGHRTGSSTYAEVVRIDSSGKVGINTTAPKQRLDVNSRWPISLGSDYNSDGARTNSTAKTAISSSIHYTNAEENVCVFNCYNDSTSSNINIGGGDANFNAATKIRFVTAANNTTVSGSNRVVIDENGYVYMYSIQSSAGDADMRYNTSTGEVTYDTSALKYKNNIRNNPDTSWIYKVPVKMYDRINGSKIDEIGVIAEDLEVIAPAYCSYKNGEIESYNKSDLVPVLLSEIQKHEKEITQLKQEIIELKKVA